MKISDKQISIFQDEKIKQFILISLEFIKTNFPSFTENKSEDELRNFIVEIVAFGKLNKIYKGINLQKLIHYFIAFKLNLPLPEKLIMVLKAIKNENVRVEDFYLNVASGRYKLAEINFND